MKIKAAFKDRETGEIKVAEIWAHRILLPEIDLEFAVHPRYCLDLEGNVRRSDFGGYQLTEISTGHAVGSADQLWLLIESFMLLSAHIGPDRVKGQLAALGTLNAL